MNQQSCPQGHWVGASLMRQSHTLSSPNHLLNGCKELRWGLRKKPKEKEPEKRGENQKSIQSQETRKISNDLKRLPCQLLQLHLRLTNVRKAYPTENFDNHWYFQPALNSPCTIPHTYKYGFISQERETERKRLTNSAPPSYLLPAFFLQIAYKAVHTAMAILTQPSTQHHLFLRSCLHSIWFELITALQPHWFPPIDPLHHHSKRSCWPAHFLRTATWPLRYKLP